MLYGSVYSGAFVNKRALLVSYKGDYYFPTYGDQISGKQFGLDYDYETNYRALKKKFEQENLGNWVIMPFIPFDPYEMDYSQDELTVSPPSWESRHFCGTDKTERDVFARLLWIPNRNDLFSGLSFSDLFNCNWCGQCDGIFGWEDRYAWTTPGGNLGECTFLYMVIILVSVMPGWWGVGWQVSSLLFIMVLFSWTGMTYYIRAAVYKEGRDYVSAAKVIGAGPLRIIFRHLLPNVISTLVTFAPFTIAAAISSITALDFLGYGLPPPTPSWENF